jgi:inorganic phosphate transporter, PiT family
MFGPVTRAVSWGIARGIVMAWIVTIPASAVIEVVGYWMAALVL